MNLRAYLLSKKIPAGLLLAGILFVCAPTSAIAQTANLNETLKIWGFSQQPMRNAESLRWKYKSIRIDAEDKKSYLTINGVRVWLGGAITANKNNVFYIARRDIEKSLSPILAPRRIPGEKITQRILIDAGHGGKDPGKENKRLKLAEKSLTLDVARRLGFILRQQGFQVFYTRTKDTFVELDDRSRASKKVDADLFISIHFNAAATASASGIETFVLTPRGMYSTNDPQKKASAGSIAVVEPGHRHDSRNALFGYHIQAALTEKIDAEDRGLRRARFAVLKDLDCPGALVECGFLTNTSEATLISGAAHREKIAQGIADGILKYRDITQRLITPPAKK